MVTLLRDNRYIEFLNKTHPYFNIGISSRGAPYFTTRIDLTEVFYSPFKQTLAKLISKCCHNLFNPRITFFGLPFEPYEQSPILSLLPSCEEMLDIAKKNGAELIALSNMRPSEDDSRNLKNLGFSIIPSFPTAKILLPSSFEQYLLGLKGKYRHNIRRNLRLFHNAGHFIEEASANKYREEIHRAYADCFSRAKFKWLPYSKAYFENISLLGHGFKTLVAKSKGEFLGFVQMIESGTSLHVARLAVDRHWIKRDAIYFRLLYAAIEHACFIKADEILLGPAAYRDKKRMGAKLEWMQNLILPISGKWRAIFWLLRKPMNKELAYLNSESLLERF